MSEKEKKLTLFVFAAKILWENEKIGEVLEAFMDERLIISSKNEFDKALNKIREKVYRSMGW